MEGQSVTESPEVYGVGRAMTDHGGAGGTREPGEAEGGAKEEPTG